MASTALSCAPDPYSYFARRVIAPLWALKERSPYLRHLSRLIHAPYRSADAVAADQFGRLQSLVSLAATQSPFYQRRFRKIGFTPTDLSCLEDLAALPLLTKDDIREQREAMLVEGLDPAGLVTMKTSGSTGVSLQLYMDEASRQWKRACAIRHDMWSGWRLGERVGAIWGNPEAAQSWRLALRNRLLSRHIPLDTLRMDDTAMTRFHKRLLRKRPTLLFGHAHSLYLFARFLTERRLRPIRPRGIVSTAMVLHDFERQAIEKVFQARVFNRYGCEEVSLVASECEAHAGLHVNCDTLVVEIVDPFGKPLPPGQPGAVVVTDLSNRAMPIIRYKVGDVARYAKTSCPCGRTYPRLEAVEGRIADYVRTPDGSYISGISLTENFAMALEGLKQLQIVQEKIDLLRLRIVPEGELTTAQTEKLAGLVKQRFGGGMRYVVETVDSIQSEHSGKYRFCISKLNDVPF